MKISNKLFVALLTIFFIYGNLFSQTLDLELLRNSPDPLGKQQKMYLLIKKTVIKKINIGIGPKQEAMKDESTLPELSLVSPDKSVLPSIEIDASKSLNIRNGLCLRGEKNQFAHDLSFLLLSSEGENLFVDYGVEIAKSNNIALSPSAFIVSVNAKGISIIGYDEEGTRRGILALKEVMYSSAVKESKFPYMRIASN